MRLISWIHPGGSETVTLADLEKCLIIKREILEWFQ
jgi:hypothetical protein